ncbi:roadblock/LC7 domain-containing protein [Streptomyces sp. MBT49]|uniref:roadblock/LC7 domain-containing protein n=1 Tax=Streptomyces TaxID=1883 RepID=UPI00190B9FB0|nr:MULTISPECIES: roadblock/LC7 domain-containing protein [unclassified Streptomyces]MBK3630414.1 roadblock/LC7 domain-containing protein [Streptomyces sp. MBT49]MBK3637299.1 roadblock/LC7 domain-containing protein [Streptomyces sp. MBT97]
MAVETEVLRELHRLRSRLPLLTGALAAGADGLVLAQDLPDGQSEGLAALTAAALGVGRRMVDLAARGEFRELLVHGAGGYLATYAAGPRAVLTLLADERTDIGRLHLEGRYSGRRIGELVAGRPADGLPVTRRGEPSARPQSRGRILGALPLRIPPQSRHRP